MRKIFTKLIGATLGLAMAVGVGVGVAANNRKATMLDASTGSYTLTFDANTSNTGTGTSLTDDASTALTTSNFFTYGTYSFTSSKKTYYWLVDGYSDIQSVSSTENCYPGKNSSLKVGKGKGDGTVNFTVVGEANLSIDSIVITAYGSGDTAKIIIDEATEATKSWTLSTDSGSHTFTYESPVKTVSLTGGAGLSSSNKVAYITQMVIKYTISSSTPIVVASPTSLYFRTGGSGQTVTASPSNFSGAVSYSWTHQSGTDCVDLTNANTATVTMTPKSSIVSLSTGVYRVTASYNTESATADVTITVDNGGSARPYTIAEAKAAIDSGVGVTDAYVKGVVYNPQTFNSTDKWITYWISDNGSDSVPFEVYRGKGVGGADFSALANIKVGDIVVVNGDLSKYNSTYQFSAGSQLVSQAHVASIAVKTAPTKVDYNSSETFDPTGLVVTATYDDTPDPTTKDFAYADLTTAFSFSPTTSTALTDETSVSITLFGKTTSQAITVTSRTITGVTLMGDMTKKTYNDGDAWDLSGLYLSIEWSNGTPNPTSVNLADVDPSDYDLDPASPTRGVTSLYIYGIYEGEEIEKTVTGITVNRRPIEDLLRTAATSFGLTETSYTPFSNKTKTLSDINSEATWAGTAACNTSKSNALQLNGTSRGIYTTVSSQYVKSVSVSFNDDNDKSLYFYASNTAYTAINASVASDEGSTLVATLNKDTLSANIVGNYKYLYIYSSGAIYMNSITVTWKFATEAVATVNTRSSLAYSATKNGENDYTFSNVYLRFGGIVSESFWDQLHTESTITSYGVLFSTNEYLGVDELKSKYNAVDGTNVKKFYNTYDPLSAEPNKSPKLYEDSTYQGVEDNYYVWNLRYTVAEANYTRVYAAVAFIVTESDGVVFLGEVRKSAKNVAADMIAGPDYDASSAEGSLNYLANLAGEL